MNPDELRGRTKLFALRVIKLFRALPKSTEAQIIGRQMLRSATSVAANYRAVCRARSDAEFLSKLSVTLEEADESEFWLELLIESELLPKYQLDPLLKEAGELTAIFSASRYTVRKSINRKSTNRK